MQFCFLEDASIVDSSNEKIDYDFLMEDLIAKEEEFNLSEVNLMQEEYKIFLEEETTKNNDNSKNISIWKRFVERLKDWWHKLVGLIKKVFAYIKVSLLALIGKSVIYIKKIIGTESNVKSFFAFCYGILENIKSGLNFSNIKKELFTFKFDDIKNKERENDSAGFIGIDRNKDKGIFDIIISAAKTFKDRFLSIEAETLKKIKENDGKLDSLERLSLDPNASEKINSAKLQFGFVAKNLNNARMCLSNLYSLVGRVIKLSSL